MTEPVTQSQLEDLKWALEDRITALQGVVADLSTELDLAYVRYEELTTEVETLRQSLTAVILLSIEHEDAIEVAEQVIRERGHGDRVAGPDRG